MNIRSFHFFILFSRSASLLGISASLRPASCILYLLSCILFLFSCQKDPTALDNANLELKAEYVEVTEAWLRLTTDTISKNSTYVVKREAHLVFKGTLHKRDTLLHDENLEPLHTYTYTAYCLINNQPTGNRKRVTITTMDTTSHNFSWQTFEFGGKKGSSSFYDVAIINENNIWAVGEIHTEDTDCWNEDSTEWIPPYNAVHYDGENWELRRIYFYLCPNGKSPFPYPIQAIFSFSKDNIWFARGGSIVHWDGIKFKHDCSINELLTGSINIIWGTSSNDLYIVGNQGLIAHYDGQEWKLIESGTEENIKDIWGVIDEETNKPYILCAVSQVFKQSENLILNIQPDNSIKRENWPFDDRKPYSVWFKDKRRAFACGDGVLTRDMNGIWRLFHDETPYFLNCIRGSEINNLFSVGAFGVVTHFNGKTWKNLMDSFYGSYTSVAVTDNLVVAVGYMTRPGIITMIKSIE